VGSSSKTPETSRAIGMGKKGVGYNPDLADE
jgi:hypothetical protein